MPDLKEWGPLAGLAGEWEGNDGVDLSFHNEDGVVGETPYLERVQLKPFGPVDNGQQHLYGLDYRMAAWRHGEEDQNPFHTEVGYWMWDAEDGQVMRCFMIPRATVLIAGTTCEPDATEFTLRADLGEPCYGILENRYLGARASTQHFECTITIEGADSWRYVEDSVVRMAAMGGQLFRHTDQNALHRTAGP